MSKALVVEHGGILSHASIVARELGIPAVIGVTDACKRFKTGELLLVDGDKAEVHQLKTNEYAR
jgi:pyruvate,water dikinase